MTQTVTQREFSKTIQKSRLIGYTAFILSACIALSANQASAQATSASKNLPAEKAGEIPPPSGQIAFIRSGDVYIMDINGMNVTLACDANNATGRLSWSPDNKWIAFTRRGEVDVKGPDGLGGKHRIYDVFKVEIDSVGINSSWWRRVTDDNGGRYPEWSRDGSTLIFTHDLNANYVNAEYPNYQLAVSDPDGGSQQYLRKDYQQAEYFSINPTLGPDGKYAFIVFFEQNAQGMYIAQRDKPLPDLDSMRSLVKPTKKVIAPSWSPDGRWIAYVHNDISKPGIWITDPTLKNRYLVYQPPAGVAPNTVPPSWSPDSKWLTFSTDDGRIWRVDITGNQLKELLGPGPNIAPGWSK